ncbi:MAG: sugar ABC transporter permease [Firmicutes bacterium]|nr:sugar ABC transporter permease [Candidatus Fiminaster equi]
MKGAKVKSTIDPKTVKLVSKRRRVTLPQWGTAWIVLIPALIFICLFMLYPIINTFLFAFIQDFQYAKGAGSFALGQFIASITNGPAKYASFGFNNFALALENSVFRQSILNTAILTIVEVPLTIIVSLLIATFLNNIKVLKGFYQTIFFLPYVTNTIALGLIFNIAFSKTPGGLVNIVLHDVFGVQDPINWLSSAPYKIGGPTATKFTQGVVLVIYSLWNGIAFKILVFMSGLATIDKQYSDAAKIDGASGFTIWRRITLPLLSPQILYITITSFIGSFKMYTGVMSVYQGINADAYYFGGDKGNDWIPVVGWIYKQVDADQLRPGIASAASLILLAIIMVITAAQFAVSKKRVHY